MRSRARPYTCSSGTRRSGQLQNCRTPTFTGFDGRRPARGRRPCTWRRAAIIRDVGPVAASTVTDLERLDADGYVVVEHAVGPDVLDAVRRELAPHLDGGEASFRGR